MDHAYPKNQKIQDLIPHVMFHPRTVADRIQIDHGNTMEGDGRVLQVVVDVPLTPTTDVDHLHEDEIRLPYDRHHL